MPGEQISIFLISLLLSLLFLTFILPSDRICGAGVLGLIELIKLFPSFVFPVFFNNNNNNK